MEASDATQNTAATAASEVPATAVEGSMKRDHGDADDGVDSVAPAAKRVDVGVSRGHVWVVVGVGVWCMYVCKCPDVKVGTKHMAFGLIGR